MNVGKLIHNRRIELKLTLEEVGNFVGVSKSTVKKWEDGYISNMKRDKIGQLAKILNLNPISLITGDENPIESNIVSLDQNKIYNIPVFESVSAGLGAYANDEIVDYMPLYINNPYDVKDMLCIRVRGNSMYPKIEDGDTVVVKKQSSVDSGSIAVVLIDNEEGLVKKVNYTRNRIELISINPEYEPKVFEGIEALRVSIVGIVKQIIKIL